MAAKKSGTVREFDFKVSAKAADANVVKKTEACAEILNGRRLAEVEDSTLGDKAIIGKFTTCSKGEATSVVREVPGRR